MSQWRLPRIVGPPGLALVALLSAGSVAGFAQSQDSVAASAGTNRLFFVPTGRTLPAGVGEVGGYWIFIPYLGYALHDRVMISGGTPLIPGVFGRYWYLAPKVGIIREERWSLAGGALLIVEAGENPLSESGERPNVAQSFFWGVLTYGTEAAGVTVGVASDMGRLSDLPDDGAMILGGELRLSARRKGTSRQILKLMAESYLPLPTSGVSPLDDSFFLVGFRVGTDRVAFEVAEWFAVEDGRVELFSEVPVFNLSFLF